MGAKPRKRGPADNLEFLAGVVRDLELSVEICRRLGRAAELVRPEPHQPLFECRTPAVEQCRLTRSCVSDSGVTGHSVLKVSD